MNSMVDITANEQRIADRVDAAVANSMVVSDQAGGVQFANAGQVMEWAKMMSVANSGVRKHLRGNPGACLAICVQAIEWGMSAYAVANKSYFVNDQIAFESQLIQAVILKRAPIKGRIKFEYTGEGQKRVCRAWARLRDDVDEIVDYTSPPISDIKVKNSPLWVGDPDQQLSYYAGRALCRRHFPDILLGVYAEDEFADGRPAIGAEQARDVTPKTLAGRLDDLSKIPAREDEPAVQRAATRGDRPAADDKPTHGEADESDHAASEEPDPGSDAGGAAVDQIEELRPKADPEKIAVLEELRPKARKGVAVLNRALGGLSKERHALLKQDDLDALRDVAEDADAERRTGA